MLSVSNRTGSLMRAWLSKLVVLKGKIDIEFKLLIFSYLTKRSERKNRPDSDIDGTVLSTYRLQIHNYGQQQIRLTNLARVQWKFKTWEVHISCREFESMPSGFVCILYAKERRRVLRFGRVERLKSNPCSYSQALSAGKADSAACIANAATRTSEKA